MSNANGKTDLTPFTMKSSGEVVLLRPLDPMVLINTRKAFHKGGPKPPIQEVEGFGPLENPNDPKYQEALKAHDEETALKWNTFLLVEGVEVEWTPEKRQRLEEKRERAKISGAVISTYDTLAYLETMVLRRAEDLQELLGAILAQTQPTKEAIDETIATFQPDLAEPTPI